MKVFVAPAELQGHPDVAAMLAAFYSRSHMSIETRLKDLSDSGFDVSKIKQSLKQYYVGYSHASIGDCGEITVFIEGVSLFTAKAIQEAKNGLYNGQETSTRFIDFANQPFPSYAGEYYQRWMGLYAQATPLVLEHYTQQYPELSAAGVKAMTFDVVRGLLPIGVQTQLSWTGSIRTLREHTICMLGHPEPQVRADAREIILALAEVFPDLFGTDEHFGLPHAFDWTLTQHDIHRFTQRVEQAKVFHDWEMFDSQQPVNPRAFGTMPIPFKIDYGSYRDLQRHRGSYIKIASVIPASGNFGGMHSWYIQRLGEVSQDVMQAALALWSEMYQAVNAGTLDRHVALLSLPLATLVWGYHEAHLEQTQYVISRRSAPDVHPTARRCAWAMHDHVVAVTKGKLKDYITVRIEPNNYAKRATQTITKNGEAIT
jgi:thymidylate synthase ThyX